MALEECKECNTKVSDRAGICPKCGIPAPTSVFLKSDPKRVIDGCYEYANTLSKQKYRGMCTDHYSKDLDRSSLIWYAVFIAVVIGLELLF